MFIPQGVIPALLLPFFDHLSIDEASYRAHVRGVSTTPGIRAITINAHASVRAIKDWSANPQPHERQTRVLQSLDPAVHVLTNHSSWLLSSLVLGCHGLLLGSGSVIAPLQAQLYAAAVGELSHAQAFANRIIPSAEVFYTEPWVDMHNRMK